MIILFPSFPFIFNVLLPLQYQLKTVLTHMDYMINQIYIFEAKNLFLSQNLLSIVVWHHVKGRTYLETDDALLRTESLKVLFFHVLFVGQNST